MAISQIEFFCRFRTRHVRSDDLSGGAKVVVFTRRVRPEKFNPSAIELDTNKNASAVVDQYRRVFFNNPATHQYQTYANVPLKISSRSMSTQCASVTVKSHYTPYKIYERISHPYGVYDGRVRWDYVELSRSVPVYGLRIIL